MPLGPVLAGIGTALAPIGGSIGSAALQQHYAIKNWQRNNEYNSPKNQVARNKEAGLPLASMFSGGAGGQSSAPQTPNVDPSLGVAKGMDQMYLNTMQRKQRELIDAQIRTETARGEREWVNTFRDTIARDREHILFQYDSKIGEGDLYPTGVKPNIVLDADRKRDLEKADLIGKNITNNIHGLDESVKRALTEDGTLTETVRQQLRNAILTEDMQKMLNNAKANEMLFANKLIDMIMDSPSGLTDIKALVYKLITGLK